MSRSSRIAEFEDYGDVDRIRLIDAPAPVPGRGEVLIEVVASGVSHMDTYVREGRFTDAVPLTFPARQGISFAGIVRARGEGVTSPAVGAEVLGHDPGHGAHADRIVVPSGAVVVKPEPVSWEVAGALYLVGLTAYSIVQSLRPTADDVVVVTAAAGGVGHLECQLLRLGGARVLGVAGEENHDYLRSIGVVPVRYGDGLAERIRDAAKGSPVTALIDNYGDYAALAEELGVRPPRFVPSEARRDTEIRYYTAPGNDPEAALQLRDVAELVATWNVRVLVSGFYALDNVQQAMVDLDARHSRGVVVLGMSPAAAPGEYLRDKLRGVYQRR
jgi:D-arabinose 1-dehydrogenase-like Zn-dependent alcohol dehydrogenase